MVGVVVVSHSKSLAEETIRLAEELRREKFPLFNGSGIEGKFFGSDPMVIKKAVENAYREEGVIIFVDLGSSVINSQAALKLLDTRIYDISKIKIADAPLVEGLVAAVSINDKRARLSDIIMELREFKNFSKISE